MSVKARPILMSAPMVNAIRDGRKTQTRRVVKAALPAAGAGEDYIQRAIRCPYGRVGDLLYVKEPYRFVEDYDDFTPAEVPDDAFVFYETDQQPSFVGRYRHARFMPRWASRWKLRLTEVRVQRLQEIAEDDARAEGIIDGGCLSCGESEPCGCGRLYWTSLSQQAKSQTLAWPTR